MDDTALDNRFAPPGSHVEDLGGGDGLELATRGQRFVGAFIDGLFALAVSLAVMLPMYGRGFAMMMSQDSSPCSPAS